MSYAGLTYLSQVAGGGTGQGLVGDPVGDRDVGDDDMAIDDSLIAPPGEPAGLPVRRDHKCVAFPGGRDE